MNKRYKIDLDPPAKCVDSYTTITGYKKIPNDYCSGGVDLGPQTLPCPNKPAMQP